MSRRLLAAAICAVALVGCAGGSDREPPAWNHDPDDAELGPDAWGEIDQSFEQCRAGSHQSPVDIADTVSAELPELVFSYPPTLFVVENTGHVIEASMPESSDGTLTIDDVEYRLLQFHFHAPSEHTRDGRSYEAEVHLVHESENGEIAVVGLFLEQSEEPTSRLVDLVLESAFSDAGGEVEIGERRSPSELFRAYDGRTVATGRYDTYDGSLTTPGCTEDVRWIVLPDTLGVSATAIDLLHELIADFPGYDGYENNNRPTQPLNDREIARDSD